MATVRLRKANGISVTYGRPFPEGWSIDEAREQYEMESEILGTGESVELIDDDDNVIAYTGPVSRAKLTYTLRPQGEEN